MNSAPDSSTMIRKDITYFDLPCTLACDAQCTKAWGVSQRPREQLTADPDDFVWLADGELDLAPVDPGTYEGRDGKPVRNAERLNRWCARECERGIVVDRGAPLDLPDWSRRRFNLLRRSEGS